MYNSNTVLLLYILALTVGILEFPLHRKNMFEIVCTQVILRFRMKLNLYWAHIALFLIGFQDKHFCISFALGFYICYACPFSVTRSFRDRHSSIFYCEIFKSLFARVLFYSCLVIVVSSDFSISQFCCSNARNTRIEKF